MHLNFGSGGVGRAKWILLEFRGEAVGRVEEAMLSKCSEEMSYLPRVTFRGEGGGGAGLPLKSQYSIVASPAETLPSVKFQKIYHSPLVSLCCLFMCLHVYQDVCLCVCMSNLMFVYPVCSLCVNKVFVCLSHHCLCF